MAVLSSIRPHANVPSSTAMAPAWWLQHPAAACNYPGWALVSDVHDPLVERARAGDREALDALFVRHRGDVARFVARVLGPSCDIEDVVQETFIQVYRSIGSFKGQSRFTTWLYRVTTNVARMHIRRAQARPRLYGVEQLPEPGDGRRPAQPEVAAQRTRRMRALHGALVRLSDKKRIVWVLHELEGVPAAEIAEIVQAPVMTVRTRLFYARRELLAAIHEDPELREALEAATEGEPVP